MKRFGFTLPEILVTLGIIGIIAALTIPALVSDVTSAQIGPKLAKAVSTFDQANEALLNANNVERITDLFGNDEGRYATVLQDHLKVNNYSGNDVWGELGGCNQDTEVLADSPVLLSKDGIIYKIHLHRAGDGARLPHKDLIGTVLIDINGASAPNALAEDWFMFTLFNDGSLRPMGGANWSEGDEQCNWQAAGDRGCQPDTVPGRPEACAGHIFENNLRVLYN